MAYNLNFIIFYTHLNWLTNIIAFVIYSVCKSLFDSCKWIIKKSVCFCPVWIFYNFFFNYRVLNILQSFSKLLIKQKGARYVIVAGTFFC